MGAWLLGDRRADYIYTTLYNLIKIVLYLFCFSGGCPKNYIDHLLNNSCMPATILFIEDNVDIRENTTELLELEGYQVLVADNGPDGISMAKHHRPDLIISDVIMRGMDGFEVFESLLLDDNTRHIPFIFTSAMSERSHIEKAFSIGHCNYLVKPYDDKDLFLIIEKVLRSKP
jgi:CheY-like chemotaxis protein